MEKENVAPSGDSPEQGAAAVASEPVPPASEAAPTATTPATESATTAPVKPATVEDEDEESDWEDLDEVLDDFSAAKQDKTKENVAPITSTSAAAAADTQTTTSAPSQSKSQDTNTSETGIDEEAFLKQLEAGMAEMVGNASGGGGVGGGGGGSGLPDEAAMADQWSALEKQLEASGMQPEDLLKQLMGDMLNLGGDGAGDAPAGSGSSAAPASSAAAGAGDQFSLGGGGKEGDFQSKIQKTMERMQDSGDRATSAAQDDSQSGVGDELLAKMLKAMESGVGEGDEPDLMKVFMEMMEDLSHKEMLYEPMMELHTKFGPWLEANRGKVEAGEMERYELQAEIVGEIVGKFDEPGYSDQNPDDKAYIWERMQKMQDAGNPPDELISNPVTDEVKNQLGAEVPGCPQQ